MPQTAAQNEFGDTDLQSAERNDLLRCMPRAEFERLRPLLTPVMLTPKQTLYEPNETISHLYFPETGTISILAEAQEGGTVEVGAVGNEGFMGVPVLLGVESTPFRAAVQIPGEAKRMPAVELRALLDGHPALYRFLEHYPVFLLHQFAQSVACARLHSLSERFARWLLVAHDRVQTDSFPVTQGFLAEMLAVHRPGVSVAAETLQEAGLISYSRGKITILDRSGLEAVSCGCYQLIKGAYQCLFPDNGACPPPAGGDHDVRESAPQLVR